MAYKYMQPTLPQYYANAAGLKFRKFDIYPISVPGSEITPEPNPYGLSSSAWTTGISEVTGGIDLSITSSNTTYVYRGYFKPDQTSNSWQFRTRSNDGSWLFIDGKAEVETVELVTVNADVKNGGNHTEETVTSANLTLSQSSDNDLYYAIAIVAGNEPGVGSIRVQFRRDGGTWQTDGTGFYFHDSRRPDGFHHNS